jgi:arginine N-succinyltransferase
MSELHVRDASAADLPEITAWLARGQRPAARLPETPDERLLVAEMAGQPTEPGGPASRLMASVRLRPVIGMDLPRAWYHVGVTVHAAAELRLFHRQRTLLLGNDHTGASELADLVCAHEAGDDGRRLPLALQAAALREVLLTALLVMASRRTRYADTLIAELPGLRDGAGQSPFWHGLGRHFYSGDPALAAIRHGDDWRSHVAALLPRQPVTTAFLPAAAQAAIAQVTPSSRPQRELLEACGLRYSHHVTVHDGGPVLEADLDALPAVTGSRSWRLDDGDSDAPHAGTALLLHEDANGRLNALRAGVSPRGSRLRTGGAVRARLGALPGDTVWALPLQAGGG